MKKIATNPYLPFWETVPDAEPYVFDERLYVFGSHDAIGGDRYCQCDYVAWSAPIENLGDWRYEGVIYHKTQDPINGAPYSGDLPKIAFDSQNIVKHDLYAPDVTKGPDGRYYLYYALDFVNVISVAVCDSPAGEYQFLDYVRYEDGSLRKGARYFDPAILSEKNGNYLYYGFCPETRFPGMEKTPYTGAMMVKLADDMFTIISEPVMVANGVESAANTPYEEHPFFEAASIRHIDDWYYFVYSSLHMHELCYGMARSPQGPFEYKGVIVSNSDLGYKNNQKHKNYYANNHGGIVKIKEQYYIFWHRHTMATQFSRQGCADKISISDFDGTISQTEITSSGLNDGPLPANGRYQAQIACNIIGPDEDMVGLIPSMHCTKADALMKEKMPFVTVEKDANSEKGLYSFITNMQKNSVAVIKYLNFSGTERKVRVVSRGKGILGISVNSLNEKSLVSIKVDSQNWSETISDFPNVEGTHAVYFSVIDGKLDFSEFEFIQ